MSKSTTISRLIGESIDSVDKLIVAELDKLDADTELVDIIQDLDGVLPNLLSLEEIGEEAKRIVKYGDAASRSLLVLVADLRDAGFTHVYVG